LNAIAEREETKNDNSNRLPGSNDKEEAGHRVPNVGHKAEVAKISQDREGRRDNKDHSNPLVRVRTNKEGFLRKKAEPFSESKGHFFRTMTKSSGFLTTVFKIKILFVSLRFSFTLVRSKEFLFNQKP